MLPFITGNKTGALQPVSFGKEENTSADAVETAAGMLEDMQRLSAPSALHAIPDAVGADALQARLVSRIAAEIVISMPQLNPQQIQQAIFLKQMYVAGEIVFDVFVDKMENLFPDRMEALDADTRRQLKEAGRTD
jgi:hypothetical protein